jgi:predicted  nucleic acid-binding Zn-ribbon protein
MEQSKQAFLGRKNEISNAYYQLFARRNEIDQKIQQFLREKSEASNEIDAAVLLNETTGTSKIESNLYDLRQERVKIDETISAVTNNGGLDSLLRKDEELKKRASTLIDNLKQVAVEDEKKRLDLEDRYEMVIEQVLQLDQERLAFVEDARKKRQLFSEAVDVTQQQGISIAKHYSFNKEKEPAYFAIGLARNSVKK